MIRKAGEKQHVSLLKDKEPGFDDRALSPRFSAGFTRYVEVVEWPVIPWAAIGKNDRFTAARR